MENIVASGHRDGEGSAEEFSLNDLDVKDGCTKAALAAALMIAAPIALSSIVRERFAGSLTPHDLEVLSDFVLYAVIVGLAVTIAAFLYGGYRKGTRSRLSFGIVTGILIVLYSFTVLVAGGLTPVLSDIGLELDMTYVALMISYASVIVVFGAFGDYIESRKKWKASSKAAKAGPGGNGG